MKGKSSEDLKPVQPCLVQLFENQRFAQRSNHLKVNDKFQRECTLTASQFFDFNFTPQVILNGKHTKFHSKILLLRALTVRSLSEEEKGEGD